jgi:hypothetical protein
MQKNMKIKYPILLLLLTSLVNLLSAEDTAIFNIESQDVLKLQIEIEPERAIQVRVYFSSLEKLKEFQKLQSENYRKPVVIQVNGETVSEPIFMFEEPYKATNLSLAFTKMEEALEQVYSLAPERKPIKAE